jgi:hypothetical protein
MESESQQRMKLKAPNFPAKFHDLPRPAPACLVPAGPPIKHAPRAPRQRIANAAPEAAHNLAHHRAQTRYTDKPLGNALSDELPGCQMYVKAELQLLPIFPGT